VKKTISKVICIKNIAAWAVIACCCVVAIVTFAQRFLEDLSSEKEIFLPGVFVLVLAVLLVLVFSVTRVLKNVRLLRQFG
jgi:FtsH-binding integral membrane protein